MEERLEDVKEMETMDMKETETTDMKETETTFVRKRWGVLRNARKDGLQRASKC